MRGDKIMSMEEAKEFLAGNLVVEEKIDGANLGISLGPSQEPIFQNRGSVLAGPHAGQWKPLRYWAEKHNSVLRKHLDHHLILFGEWCYAKHSIFYTQLPDYFIGYDVYDLRQSKFWSTDRRDELLSRMGLSVVPVVFKGECCMGDLVAMLAGRSLYSESPREGLYLRREHGPVLISRAKLVNPSFTQAIHTHWSKAPFQANQLMSAPWH